MMLLIVLCDAWLIDILEIVSATGFDEAKLFISYEVSILVIIHCSLQNNRNC